MASIKQNKICFSVVYNEIQDLTSRPEEKGRVYGVEVSSEKSKELVNSTNQNTPINTMNGQNLEELDSFRYCGSTLSKNGTSTKEIKTSPDTTSFQKPPAWHPGEHEKTGLDNIQEWTNQSLPTILCTVENRQSWRRICPSQGV